MTLARAFAVLLAAGLAALAVAASASAAPPTVRAPAAILVQPATGDVVVSRNADQRRSIASTTKLMTALLTLERASLDDVMTTVDYGGSPVESLGGFRGGERVTVRDLLRALLVASANDAAATLAARVAGSRAAFVRLMNQRARELKLTNTRFSNPIGLDQDGNYSSASDLVKITLILQRNAFFRQTTDLPKVTIHSGDHPRTYTNRNRLVRQVAEVTGVKTGHTSDAGYVLVGSATRDGVSVVSAVLGDATEAQRDSDTLALLRYGLSRYRVVPVVKEDQGFGRASLEHRDESVALLAARGVTRVARTDERFDVRVVDAPSELDGPLPQGTRVGTIEVRQRGRVVGRVPLVTARKVDAATFMDRLRDFLSTERTLLLLGVFAACSLLLVAMRRRAVRRRARRTRRAPA